MSKKILVVCAGNAQRSQALSHYIREYAIREHLDLEVKSAGISIERILKYIAEHGSGTPTLTEKVIREQDKLIFGDSRRQNGTMKPITKEMVDDADIIIAVDPYVNRIIGELFPHVKNKIKIAKALASDKEKIKGLFFVDPHSSNANEKYRRGAVKDNKITGQTFRANWVMADEARRLAKRIVPKINRL